MITAQGHAITDLRSQVDGVSASATFRAQTVAAPSGWNSRIALQARVGTSDSYKNAGIYFDVTPTNSRIVVSADQFIVTNGSDVQAPLTFINGVLALQVANIGNVTAGVLRSPDNKVVFNLADKTLIFSDNT